MNRFHTIHLLLVSVAFEDRVSVHLSVFVVSPYILVHLPLSVVSPYVSVHLPVFTINSYSAAHLPVYIDFVDLAVLLANS